jgi:hypothetical protein
MCFRKCAQDKEHSKKMAEVISKKQEAENSLHNAYANFKKTGTSPLEIP